MTATTASIFFRFESFINSNLQDDIFGKFKIPLLEREEMCTLMMSVISMLKLYNSGRDYFHPLHWSWTKSKSSLVRLAFDWAPWRHRESQAETGRFEWWRVHLAKQKDIAKRRKPPQKFPGRLIRSSDGLNKNVKWLRGYDTETLPNHQWPCFRISLWPWTPAAI